MRRLHQRIVQVYTGRIITILGHIAAQQSVQTVPTLLAGLTVTDTIALIGLLLENLFAVKRVLPLQHHNQ